MHVWVKANYYVHYSSDSQITFHGDLSIFLYIYIYISYVACFISVLHIFAKETRALMQSNWGRGGAHLNARCKLYEQFVCLPPKTASITSLEFRNQWNSYLSIKWQSKLKFCYSRLFSWKFRAHCLRERKISLDVQIKPFFAVQLFLPICSGDFDHPD